MEKGSFKTLKEFREVAGIPLTTEDFVSSQKPCERFYVPAPKVPRYLMPKGNEDAIEQALQRCTSIVGTWGDLASERYTPEFEQSASIFKALTGVDAWDVISLARIRFLSNRTV